MASTEPDDFGEFYARTYASSYRTALGVTGSPAVAEDATQQAYRSAYRHRGNAGRRPDVASTCGLRLLERSTVPDRRQRDSLISSDQGGLNGSVSVPSMSASPGAGVDGGFARHGIDEWGREPLIPAVPALRLPTVPYSGARSARVPSTGVLPSLAAEGRPFGW